MKRIGTTLAVVGLCGVAVACDSSPQTVTEKEQIMTASGFTSMRVDTPERRSEAAKLPPYKFSRETRDGRVLYTYPDPTVCGCLYIGSQGAYDSYRRTAYEKGIIDAQANETAMNDWQWAPWGGLRYSWYYYEPQPRR